MQRLTLGLGLGLEAQSGEGATNQRVGLYRPRRTGPLNRETFYTTSQNAHLILPGSKTLKRTDVDELPPPTNWRAF